MKKRVRDLMRVGLITCPPRTVLGEAARLLTRHHVHALVVIDPAGMPLGVLSDMDLLAGEWLSTDAANLETMRAMTVEQLMTAPAACIDADEPVEAAAARMRSERIHRLVVTEMDRGVGVLAVSDLVAGLAQAPTARRIVADAMSRALVVCRDDTPIGAAARAMTERRTRSVVVVEASGRPVGVVTGFDLLGLLPDGDLQQPVSAIMRAPLTIHPTDSLQAAADLMLRHHVHRLVVLDPDQPEGMPLGLISTFDIVVEMAAPGSAW